jgi:dUTP pyrophosphatase
MNLLFKKTSELATTPTRGSDFAAGYDLYSTEDYLLQPMERKLFKTGLSIAIPNGLYGRIAPRSGLAYKDGLDVMAGVIDEDYRGDVGVILINLGDKAKEIKIGDKIAQIIFENYTPVTFKESTELPSSIRGDGGFGSSDRKIGFYTPKDPVIITDKDKVVIGITKGKSISDLYEKVGGIPVKKRYSDEIKERDQ